MIVIGLTGGIASGKSAVATILSGLGAGVIDADSMGHQAFRPHTNTWRDVVDAFGKGILRQDDEIDRTKLAEIVFNDPESLEKLNMITHPAIRRMVEQAIETMRGQRVDVVVLEAALLIEANWIDLVDQVWVTVAPAAMVIKRLREKKGYTEAQSRARIRSQMPTAERKKHADVVIENDSDLPKLKEKVEKLWHNLQS